MGRLSDFRRKFCCGERILIFFCGGYFLGKSVCRILFLSNVFGFYIWGGVSGSRSLLGVVFRGLGVLRVVLGRVVVIGIRGVVRGRL